MDLEKMEGMNCDVGEKLSLRCKICGRPAVIFLPSCRMAVCRKHLERILLKRVRRVLSHVDLSKMEVLSPDNKRTYFLKRIFSKLKINVAEEGFYDIVKNSSNKVVLLFSEEVVAFTIHLLRTEKWRCRNLVFPFYKISIYEARGVIDNLVGVFPDKGSKILAETVCSLSDTAVFSAAEFSLKILQQLEVASKF